MYNPLISLSKLSDSSFLNKNVFWFLSSSVAVNWRSLARDVWALVNTIFRHVVDQTTDSLMDKIITHQCSYEEKSNKPRWNQTQEVSWTGQTVKLFTGRWFGPHSLRISRLGDRSYHRHEKARTHHSCAIVLRRVTQCRSLTLHNVHCSSGYTQECLETFRKQEITGRRPKLEEELGRTQRRVKLRRLSSCKGARASSRSEHCCD